MPSFELTRIFSSGHPGDRIQPLNLGPFDIPRRSSPMEESAEKFAMAKTAAFLADTEKMIADIRKFQEELIPARTAELRKTIRVTTQSANSLLLTAHLSLHNKIAHEQQKRASARQAAILAALEEQQILWTSMLKRTKEQKKQLKRLQRVQQAYGVASRSQECDEEYEAGLEKKMMLAMDRTVRAQQAHETMVQLQADIARMQDHSESHQKQVDLDEKAMERAKEAVRKARVKKSEKMKCEKLEEEKAKGDEWLPGQYKVMAKKEYQRQEPQAKKKRKARQ